MDALTTHEFQQLWDSFVQKYPDINFVRFYWLDFSARLRAKVVTRRFCEELAQKQGSFISAGSNCMNKIVDTSSSGGNLKCGTDELYPDWSTLRHCPHVPGHASILCNVRHIGDNFQSCPRTALMRMLDQFEKLSISTFVGFEIELAILEGPPDALRPVEVETGWLDSAVLRTPYLSLLEELVLALQSSEILVREFHPEGSSKGMHLARVPSRT
jgi:glutamine synthetase